VQRLVDFRRCAAGHGEAGKLPLLCPGRRGDAHEDNGKEDAQRDSGAGRTADSTDRPPASGERPANIGPGPGRGRAVEMPRQMPKLPATNRLPGPPRAPRGYLTD